MHCRQLAVSKVLINGIETNFSYDNFLEQPADPRADPQTHSLFDYECSLKAAHVASDDGELCISLDPSVFTETRRGLKKRKKKNDLSSLLFIFLSSSLFVVFLCDVVESKED